MRGKETFWKKFSFPRTPILQKPSNKGYICFYIVCSNILPRVILSGGRSPQSNPEGVCEAQDLRGTTNPVRDPKQCSALFDPRVARISTTLRMTRTKSNPAGVCEAQDLRGDSKFSFEIPTLCVALCVRLAIKLLAQDDTQNINSANYKNINFAFCILHFAFIKSPSLKVFEGWGCGGYNQLWLLYGKLWV